MAAWLAAGAVAAGGVEAGQAAGGGSVPSRTHFAIDRVDVAAIREIRAAAAARIAELRQEPAGAEMHQRLADAEAELAVLDEALEEFDGAQRAAADGG